MNVNFSWKLKISKPVPLLAGDYNGGTYPLPVGVQTRSPALSPAV